MSPYKIGIQLGVKFVEKGTDGMNVHVVESNEQLLKLVDSGRVDIAVMARTNGLLAMKVTNLPDIKMVAPTRCILSPISLFT